MAGVGDSVVVSRGGMIEEGFAVGDECSLQELIDSELAMRIGGVDPPVALPRAAAAAAVAIKQTQEFIARESEHSSPPSLDPQDDWTTVEEAAVRMSPNTNNTNNEDGPASDAAPQESEHQTADPRTLETMNHLEEKGDKSRDHLVNNNHLVDSVDEFTLVENHITENRVIENNHTTVISEEVTVTEKKTKKKKSSTTENGDAVVTKVKKKKSKKSDEKENHISVLTNGHSYPESSSPVLPEEDDLSNVCVKNLTESYVSVAAKSFNSPTKHSEEPVLPSVPIRELRRSFGDIHKACENSDLSSDWDDDKQLRARSLGDLRKIEKQPVVTGVNVKQLAAFWRTVSVESIARSSSPAPTKLDKSSFSKFDQLSKKTVLHVRSSDPAKAQKTFSQSSDGDNASCKACGKTVFAMEQIKAERAVWHKNCFRCHSCNKQLTVDIYSSHEGDLYCKPHFRELFKPKAVIEPEEPASDKPDLGLEELSSLNVKSKFQVFEKGDSNNEIDRSPSKVDVKRSPSILGKLAKFQRMGMNVGVTDEDLDGYVYEESTSEEEEEDEEESNDSGVVKCRKIREKPVSFGKMDDVKKNFESGATKKEERLEEKKKEIQNLRSRLFMGKQVKMKEMYEQAVAESEGKISKKESDVVRSEKAKTFRERFEKGEVTHSDEEEENKHKVNDDMSVFEEGISKKSRSLFLEMDAKSQAAPPTVNHTPTPKEPSKHARDVFMVRQVSDDIVRSSEPVQEVAVETADISSRFKFFEKYRAPEKEKKAFRITPPREGQIKTESPEREIYRDPDVIRSDDKVEDDQVVKRSQTASKMLSIFRQMEEQKEVIPEGPKPKKEFTPPPGYQGNASSEEETEEESEEEEDEEESEEETEVDGVVKSSYKMKDEFLEVNKTSAAKARQLAAKFESWEPDKQSGNSAITMLDSEQPSLESTKSLREHFESLKNQKNQQDNKSRPKVNRFVDTPPTICSSCDRKVYPLEKIETDGKIFHKACFRCSHCNCILRMDSYTLNNGHLYCMPHFKQLFISKGNYDEGFGVDQHKRKWDISSINGSI